MDAQWATLIAEGVKWLVELIMRYATQGEDAEIKRVIDVLPNPLKSRLVAEAEREAMRRELAEELGEQA